MIEVNIPKDILRYKSKFIANFTVREIVCLSLGALSAVVGYNNLFASLPGKGRMYAAALIAIPFFIVGFIKLYGQPFEKIAKVIIIDNLIYPAVRKNEIHYPEYEKYKKTGVGKTKNGKPAKAAKPCKQYKSIK